VTTQEAPGRTGKAWRSDAKKSLNPLVAAGGEASVLITLAAATLATRRLNLKISHDLESQLPY
jgi:hypothetical protein